MTKDEAISAYRAIHAEIDGYLVDVRPKLKNYDATLVHERVRRCIVENFEKAADATALRAVAMAKFRSYPFKFLKGKGPKP